MPALVKVKLNEPPGLIVPEFQTEVLLVVVWAIALLFVQVTVWPTLIVSVAGWKLKLTMLILRLGLGVAVWLGVGVLVAVFVDVCVNVGVLVCVAVAVSVAV